MLHPSLSRISRLAFTLALAVTLSACAGNKKKDQYAGSEDGDFVTGSPLADRQDGVSFLGNNVDRNRFSPVYFAFDSYDVDFGEASKLDAVARHMSSSSGELIVAGFTDERGTAEYNRGLGERRAQAVRSYLIGAGVDASLIQTVSFGADMPADPGSGESAWAKNRRAEFGFVK